MSHDNYSDSNTEPTNFLKLKCFKNIAILFKNAALYWGLDIFNSIKGILKDEKLAF